MLTTTQKTELQAVIESLRKDLCIEGHEKIKKLVEIIINEPIDPPKPKKEWRVGTIIKANTHEPFVILQTFRGNYFSAGADSRVNPFSNQYTKEEIEALVQKESTVIIGHVEWVEDGKP